MFFEMTNEAHRATKKKKIPFYVTKRFGFI